MRSSGKWILFCRGTWRPVHLFTQDGQKVSFSLDGKKVADALDQFMASDETLSAMLQAGEDTTANDDFILKSMFNQVGPAMVTMKVPAYIQPAFDYKAEAGAAADAAGDAQGVGGGAGADGDGARREGGDAGEVRRALWGGGGKRCAMMGDLKSAKWMVVKAVLLVLVGLLAGGILVMQMPGWRTVVLLAVAVWGFARAYYFAFYVIEKYIDPGFRFAGLMSVALYYQWHAGAPCGRNGRHAGIELRWTAR